jgi:hypothetical protein
LKGLIKIKDIVIRENIDEYMLELKQWLESIKAAILERMEACAVQKAVRCT